MPVTFRRRIHWQWRVPAGFTDLHCGRIDELRLGVLHIVVPVGLGAERDGMFCCLVAFSRAVFYWGVWSDVVAWVRRAMPAPVALDPLR